MRTGEISVADPHLFDADPEADLDPTFHSDADPDPNPASQNDGGSGSGCGSESATLGETARTVLKCSSLTQDILRSWAANNRMSKLGAVTLKE